MVVATKTLLLVAVEVLKNKKNDLSMVTTYSMEFLVLEPVFYDDTNPNADIEDGNQDGIMRRIYCLAARTNQESKIRMSCMIAMKKFLLSLL